MVGLSCFTLVRHAGSRSIPPKTWKKLETILSDGHDIADLFIALTPSGEAAEEQRYDCALLATMRSDLFQNQLRREQTVTKVQHIRALLDACDGIKVLDDEVASEAEVTIEDLRAYRRFGFEYMSLDRREQHDIPPSDRSGIR